MAGKTSSEGKSQPSNKVLAHFSVLIHRKVPGPTDVTTTFSPYIPDNEDPPFPSLEFGTTPADQRSIFTSPETGLGFRTRFGPAGSHSFQLKCESVLDGEADSLLSQSLKLCFVTMRRMFLDEDRS